MDDDLELASAKCDCTKDELYSRLKLQYGGYHFARNSSEIYNPHCLIDFMTGQMFQFCWFSSFMPSFIHRHLSHFKTNMNALCYEEVGDYFYKYTEHMVNAMTLLYHRGYLTIQDYDRESDTYTLSIPNTTVYTDLLYGQTPLAIGLDPDSLYKCSI